MCKRIIPFVIALFFVATAVAQDIAISKVNVRQGSNASPRIPCVANIIDGPITFGTVPRVNGMSNSTPGIGQTIFLCADDAFDVFDIGGDMTVFGGDPDGNTRPGIGFAIYDCEPTVDGADLLTVLGDECLLGDPMTSNELRIAIDLDDPFADSLTFTNLSTTNTITSIPDRFGGGAPVQWWFAPMTFDAIENDVPAWEGTPEGPCVSVDLDQGFSVVYLNPIGFINTTYPFGGNGSQVRLNIGGGLPEFDDTQNYTVDIINTDDPSIRGSVISGELEHRGFPIISVPTPGEYRITLSDGRSCSVSTTIVMNQFEEPDNPLDIVMECPAGATVGQEFCIDVTAQNFDSIVGATFFICWDTAVLDSSRVTNVIDGTWLIGQNLLDEGALIPSFFSQDISGGTTYPDGTILFSICFTPTAVGSGSTMIEYCSNDPRAGSNSLPDVVVANSDGSSTELTFPTDPANQCPPIIITDPDALNTIVIADSLKNACPGDDNGSFSIQVLGGTAPYEVRWIDENGNNDGPVMVNDQDGIATIIGLSPGDYTYEVFDGGVGVDRKFTGELGPITIEEANIGVNVVTISPPVCNGDDNGVIGAEIALNGVILTDISNYNFIWTDVNGDTISTEETAMGPAPANYQVVVSSNNGCTFSDSGTLTQPAEMVVTPNQVMPSCSGVPDGAIDVSDITGGNGPFTFAWSDGNNTALNNGIVSGKYIYTVTDIGGCTVIDSIDLVAVRELIINVNSLTNVQCFNFENGSIDVGAGFRGPPPSGASTYDFTWSPNAETIDNSVVRSSLADDLAPGTYSVTLTNSDLPGCQAIETFEITEPDSLMIENIDITPLTSCDLPVPDGAATAIVIGGTPLGDYEYVWSDTAGMVLENTVMATGLDAGPIRLTVNDNNGCVTTVDTVIGTPPPPEVQFFEDVALNCATDLGDLQVIAVPGRSGVTIAEYQWSHDPTLNNDNAFNVSPDTFIVTIIDSDKCATVDTAIVSAPPPIQTSAVDFLKEPCFGANDGELSVNITGGMSTGMAEGYTLEWTASSDNTPVGTSSILMDVAAGDYILSVVDANNCTFDTTITLNNIPKIEVTFDLANVTGVDCFDTVDPNDCNGFASATAEYEGAGGGIFTFTWGATGETVSATDAFSSSSLCAGMQALSVSDGQCEVVDSVDIPSPERLELDLANLSLTPADCFGDANGAAEIAAIGGTPGYQFAWPDGGNETTKMGLVADIYQITITDRNDCIATHDLEITQPESALTATIDIDNTNNVTCAGDLNGLITIIATGGNQNTGLDYVWTNNVSNGPSAAGLAPGDYTIDITDVKDCMASVTYTVETPAPITALIEWDPIQCNGFQTGIRVSALSGGNGNDYSFSVDNSPARPTIETITEFGGERLISLFDETNCRVDTLVTIPQPRPLTVGFAENLVEVDLGSSITLNLEIDGDAPVADIFWTQDGGAVDTAFLCSFDPCDNPTVNPLNNATYTAFVTDANGCMSDGSIIVEVDKNRNVYIPNVFAPNNAGFDTNDRFAVFTGSGVSRINYAQVYNRWGTVVADVGAVDITSVGQTVQVWDGQLKGQKANQGVYIYIVEVEFIDGQTLLYRGDIALLR